MNIAVTRRTLCFSLAASILPLHAHSLTGSAYAATPPKGSFRGRVVAEWLPNGLEMKLAEPFEYIAADGTSWPVPAGAIVDGASIPRVFWSIIGGPFEGLYREPSVVHDHYCGIRTRPVQAVHSVFFEAMLTSGVPESRAWLMYKAVSKFGPTWTEAVLPEKCGSDADPGKCPRSAPAPADVVIPTIDKARLTAFANEVESEVSPTDLALLKDAIAKMN
jgi:hypothetical protein